MTFTKKTPEQYAAEGDSYDITGHVGPSLSRIKDLWERDPPEWPMYSYDRPAYLLWNAIGGALNKRGWSDAKIKAYPQSKLVRTALDNELGEMIERVGKRYAKQIADDDVPDSWIEG